MQYLAQGVHVSAAQKRRPTGEQFVQDRPQAVHVRRRADLGVPPNGLLGGHVVRRPQDGAALRQLGSSVFVAGEAEVRDLGQNPRNTRQTRRSSRGPFFLRLFSLFLPVSSVRFVVGSLKQN